MEPQPQLDELLTAFFREAKALTLTQPERELLRYEVESHLLAHSVSLIGDGRHTIGMNYETHYQNGFGAYSLEEEERSSLRSGLLSFMRQVPLAVKTPQEQYEDAPLSFARVFEVLFPRVGLACLIFIAIGTTVTFAAQSSIPGDFLYPFKVKLYEPIVSSLALTETSHASLESSEAINRLKEAEELAAEARLTKDEAAALRQNFSYHVQNAEKNLQDLASSGNAGDASEAVAIGLTLKSYVESHAAIVQAIDGVDTTGNTHALPAALPVRISSSESSSDDSLQQQLNVIFSLPIIAAHSSSSSSETTSAMTTLSSQALSSTRETSSEPSSHNAVSSQQAVISERSSADEESSDAFISSATSTISVLQSSIGEAVSSVANLLNQL